MLSTPPTLRRGQAVQGGRRCRPTAPPVGKAEPYAWGGTYPPRRPRLRAGAGYVWPCTPRPGQHRCLYVPSPPCAGMGTRVWGGRAPKSLPCPGIAPAPCQPSPGVGALWWGMRSWKVPDTSLLPTLYLKGGKSQLGARHSWERDRGALSAMPAGCVGQGGCIAPGGMARRAHIAPGKPGTCTPLVASVKSWHSTPEHTVPVGVRHI